MGYMVSGDDLVKVARSALGTQYVWGGNDLKTGVDCSGLVQQVFAEFGIQLPRVTYDQVGVGASVSRKQLQVGDLVFFDTDRSKSGPDHVGIYIGGGKFIHAPRPGKPVQIGSLTDSYYNDRLMAIRRVPGVQGSPSGIGGIDPATFSGGGEEVRKSSTELAETYGMAKSFMDSNPELKRLLNRATKEQWDPDLFQAELKNTKWWKVTSDSMRQAQLMAKTDPATYKATISASRVAAEQMAVKMGAILSDGALNKLATNIVNYGWQEAQIQDFLGNFIKFNDQKVLGGQAGAAFQQLRTLAYENGVSVTDEQLKTQAAYVVKGVSNMEKEAANIRGIAMGKYPAYADQIAAGVSMKQIAQPYIQSMSKIMEIPDTDIDLSNPKIKAALNRVGPDGKPQPLSLTDFETSLKDTPDWRRTAQAQNQVMQVGRQVLQQMGLVR